MTSFFGGWEEHHTFAGKSHTHTHTQPNSLPSGRLPKHSLHLLQNGCLLHRLLATMLCAREEEIFCTHSTYFSFVAACVSKVGAGVDERGVNQLHLLVCERFPPSSFCGGFSANIVTLHLGTWESTFFQWEKVKWLKSELKNLNPGY